TVERRARPRGSVATRAVDPHAPRTAPPPGDDLIDDGAGEIGRDERVAVDDCRVDHLPRKRALRTRSVDHDFVAVPRLDRRDEISASGEPADGRIARPP